MKKGCAHPFGTLFLAAIIVATIAATPVAAVSEDVLKLHFEQWIVKDNTLQDFPKYLNKDTGKSSKEIPINHIWSADSETLTGEAPFCVRFAATTPGGTWDFGDKCYSGEQYHIHTYKTVGTYTAVYTPPFGDIEKSEITVTKPTEKGFWDWFDF